MINSKNLPQDAIMPAGVLASSTVSISHCRPHNYQIFRRLDASPT
jgi:hypothetical protein